MASFIAARCTFSWPASWLGSACSAIVEYDRMSLISTVTSTRSVSPIGRASRPQLLGQPAGQQPGQRLALLLAVHDRLVQQPQPLQRALLAGRDALGQLHEHRLHLGVDGLGRHARWPPRWP